MAYVNVNQDVDKWIKHFKKSVSKNGKFKKVKQIGSGQPKEEPKVVTITAAKLGEDMAKSEYKKASTTQNRQLMTRRR